MEEKILSVRQGSIHYWTNDFVPGRRTLVFLPGLTADHRLFERQVAYFARRYNVLVWDAPGHNASRPFTLDFSLMDKAGWLHDILAVEAVTQPVLIGQSMGGYVSQCYMERYPHTVAAFVSIDSGPLQRQYFTAAELWLLKHTELIYRPYPWQALIKSGAQGCAETVDGQELMRRMMTGYDKDYYCLLTCHGYRILGEAVEAGLPYAIDCPALLLCGEHDRAGSTKHYNRRWAAETQLPLTWIAGAGHNSNTDKPEQINRLIEDFLTASLCINSAESRS